MKKLLSFLIFTIIALPAYSADIIPSSLIEDELIKSSIFQQSIKPMQFNKNGAIYDELLDPKNYGGKPFRLGVYTSKTKDTPISDELIDKDFLSSAGKVPIIKKEIPDDHFFEKNININRVRKIKSKIKYDFTKEQVPVRIKIAKQIKSTKTIEEGMDIPFIAEHSFEIKGKKYEKGTTIYGRIETISDSDKMGVPECLKIDNFYLKDGDEEINFYGSITKVGANRAIWVYPIYQAGNICLYAAGFVVVPIHGGRAKLLTKESFTIFYETQ